MNNVGCRFRFLSLFFFFCHCIRYVQPYSVHKHNLFVFVTLHFRFDIRLSIKGCMMRPTLFNDEIILILAAKDVMESDRKNGKTPKNNKMTTYARRTCQMYWCVCDGFNVLITAEVKHLLLLLPVVRQQNNKYFVIDSLFLRHNIPIRTTFIWICVVCVVNRCLDSSCAHNLLMHEALKSLLNFAFRDFSAHSPSVPNQCV